MPNRGTSSAGASAIGQTTDEDRKEMGINQTHCRSIDFRFTKGVLWHAIEFGRNLILPAIGIVYIVVDVASGEATVFDFSIFFIFLFLTAIGVSVGLHRLLSHRSMKAVPAAKYALIIFGSTSWQRPLFPWVARHRLHHKYSDAAGDYHSPYIKFNGEVIGRPPSQFIHSHYYWLHISDPNPEIYNKVIPDLISDPILRSIDKNYNFFCLVSILVPALIGYAYYFDLPGFLDGLMWGGLGRIGIFLHFTWLINSACHLVGPAPYKVRDNSRNIGLLGILVVGEGYHNNHHAFPYSPNFGFDRGQYDLGWLAIRGLEKAGLVYDLLPTPDMITRRITRGVNYENR